MRQEIISHFLRTLKMMFKRVSILSLLFCICYVNSIPLFSSNRTLHLVPKLPFLPSIPFVSTSQKLAKGTIAIGVNGAKGAVNGAVGAVNGAKSVAGAVIHPKATISSTKEAVKDKSLDIAFEIARRTFGPLFPMFLLFNFYMKLKLGTAYNYLEVSEQFMKSYEFHPSESGKDDGIYQKAIKFIQKKTLDPPRKKLEKKSIKHAEYVVGSIKSRMPEVWSGPEFAFWSAFEAGLTNDLKIYFELLYENKMELANIKYKELEAKLKIIFKEHFKDSFN